MTFYERGPVVTPSEYGNFEHGCLRVRVTRNCPWNKCKFCAIYKGEIYEPRPINEVLKDIKDSQKIQELKKRPYTSAFLQDSDSIGLSTSNLIRVLEKIKEIHPKINRITTYGRNYSIAKKSLDELKELKGAGLSGIYRGLESGYDPLLKYMEKGTTAKSLIESGLKVKESGIELNDFVMPGLGGNLHLEGKETWKRHVEETARVVNETNPDYVRLRTLFIYPNTPLWEKAKNGKFKRLSDSKIIKEIKLFIEKLDGFSGQIKSNYVSNILLEVEGNLPEDKEKILVVIDKYLALSPLEQGVFRVGMLSGGPHTLDEFEKKGGAQNALEKVIEKFFKRFTRRYVQ